MNVPLWDHPENLANLESCNHNLSVERKVASWQYSNFIHSFSTESDTSQRREASFCNPEIIL